MNDKELKSTFFHQEVKKCLYLGPYFSHFGRLTCLERLPMRFLSYIAWPLKNFVLGNFDLGDFIQDSLEVITVTWRSIL